METYADIRLEKVRKEMKELIPQQMKLIRELLSKVVKSGV